MQVTRPQFGSLQLTARYFNDHHGHEGYHVAHHFTPDSKGNLFVTVDEDNQQVHISPDKHRDIITYSAPGASKKGQQKFLQALYTSLNHKLPKYSMVWNAFLHPKR